MNVPGNEVADSVQRVSDVEVGQIRVALTIEHHARRAHVAVGDTVPVGIVEGGTDGSEDHVGLLHRQGGPLNTIGESPAAHPAHHQKCPLRTPPVVEQRGDMRMLETGHHLRFDLETTDERRVVCVLGVDDLDCHLTAQGRLIATMNKPKGTRPHLLSQLVSRKATLVVRQRRWTFPGQQRRKHLAAPVDTELVDKLVLGEALDVMRTKTADEQPRSPGRRHLLLGVLGEQYLAGMGARHQRSSPPYGWSGDIVGSNLKIPHSNRKSHPWRLRRGPPLHFHRRMSCRSRRPEPGISRGAGVGEHPAAMRRNRTRDNGSLFGQDLRSHRGRERRQLTGVPQVGHHNRSMRDLWPAWETQARILVEDTGLELL